MTDDSGGGGDRARASRWGRLRPLGAGGRQAPPEGAHGTEEDRTGGAAITVAPEESRGATAETVTQLEPREAGESTDPPPERPLLRRPTVVSGIYAWCIVGVALVLLGVLYVLDFLGLIVFPLALAMFPAALLLPLTNRLKRRLPPAIAALVVLLGFLAILSGIVAVLIPTVMEELTRSGGIVESAEAGFQQVQDFLRQGPFGFQPVELEDILQAVQDQVANAAELAPQVLSTVGAVFEGVAGLLLGLVALFFYLKDGPAIGNFLRDLFPERWRNDAAKIGNDSWQTVAGYIRGQLIVGFVDAVFIGIGLAILGVPLVLPLAVITFIGGLFPIVGAAIAGLLAVLVALATQGVTDALITLGIVVAVQQIEGDVLAPIVLGRATQLHPLAILAALAAGGVIAGILGAFLAVPVVASAARGIGYIRSKIPG